MSPSLANLVYTLGILGLFYLNRDESVRTSKALWLPVLYVCSLGSRPVSFWLGGSAPDPGQIMLEGSPIDAAFFGILLIAALAVLVQRGQRVLRILGESKPILIYFIYCLLSVLWSEFSGIAGKRWIKAVGDLAMVLVVLTDPRPMAALRRLFSSTGFVMIPLSVLFIKYYPYLGRSYDPWSGRQMFTGISYDKNVLGVITYLISLGTAWQVLELLRSYKSEPRRRRILYAQGILLALGIYILVIADSATSILCFGLGLGLMLVANLRFMRRSPGAIHAVVLFLVVGVSSAMLLGGGASMAQALGRNPNLTGRTDIWAAVIPLAANPVIGAGFESFWLSESVHTRLWQVIPGLPLNEAHDGYIEVYLQLGWVGVGLIALILASGYRRSVAAFRRDPNIGGLLVAFTVSAAVYNVTEAGFRMMHPMWEFLLLAVVASGAVASGIVFEAAKPNRKKPGGLLRAQKEKWVTAGATLNTHDDASLGSSPFS